MAANDENDDENMTTYIMISCTCRRRRCRPSQSLYARTYLISSESKAETAKPAGT